MKKLHLKYIIKEIIKEDIDSPGIFVPRNIEGRKEKKKQLDYKKIQDYIKNGSKGDLELENSPITELPNNLQVGGSLYLSYSQITELPNNLNIGGFIKLSYTPIQKLPDNLKVVGSLWLHDSQITELPNNLEVGADLNLFDTPLSKKYSKQEIRDIIEKQGGTIGRKIYSKT